MNYTCREYWGAMLNASLCKVLILKAVCEQPAHGYEIVRRVAAQTGNCCTPTEGTVYPVLREFERCGCIRGRTEKVGERTRRVYTATAKGRRAFETGRDVWQRGLQQVRGAMAGVPRRRR